MWNPYGYWAAASARGGWNGLESAGGPSGSAGTYTTSNDAQSMQITQGSPLTPRIPTAQAAQVQQSSPSPARQNQPQAATQANSQILHPSQSMSFNTSNNTNGETTTEQKVSGAPSGTSSLSQNQVCTSGLSVPGAGLMGVNPWMQVPGFGMGWGNSTANANIPAPFNGWMGAMAMGAFPPQMNSQMAALQSAVFPQLSQVVHGMNSGGGNNDDSVQSV